LDVKKEFPKLTISNSIVVDGSIYYFKKDGVIYGVWEYRSGIKVRSFSSKDEIKPWIEINSDKIKLRIKQNG
jgi:L-rhamnose mutarotase